MIAFRPDAPLKNGHVSELFEFTRDLRYIPRGAYPTPDQIAFAWGHVFCKTTDGIRVR